MTIRVAEKKYRPTKMMLQVLRWMAAGLGTHHSCHGQSAHGGMASILFALMSRGYIDRDYKITKKGREAIK